MQFGSSRLGHMRAVWAPCIFLLVCALGPAELGDATLRFEVDGLLLQGASCAAPHGLVPLADGALDRVIEMPAQNITTCTFGGAGLTTLYVTTAAADRPPTDRLAGSLFAIETGIGGMRENLFRTG